VSEITNLRIEDISLGGTPTIFVSRSKRGKSRFVEIDQIPDVVLDYLRKFISYRLSVVENDRTALLIINPTGLQFSRQYLNSIFEKAFRACDIRIGIGEKKISHPSAASRVCKSVVATRNSAG